MSDSTPNKMEVKFAPGPKFPTPQERKFSELIRDYVQTIMDTTIGSTSKQIQIIADEIDRRMSTVSVPEFKEPKKKTPKAEA